MARPLHFTDDALLQAAYEVFKEHGMEATTAEIARRAGASEGTLFKRFQSKWGLFHALLEHTNRFGRAWTEGLADRVGRGKIEDELEAAANEGIEFFRLSAPLHMVSGLSPAHMKMVAKSWGDSHPAMEARRRMEGYFEAERRLGRIGKVDVEVVARIFQGAIYNFAVMEILTGPYESSPLPQEKFVRHFVSALLHGVLPNAASGAADKAPPEEPTKKTQSKRTRSKRTQSRG